MTPERQDAACIGKTVGSKTYLHVDALGAGSFVGTDLSERLAAAEALAGVRRGEDFNLVRVDTETGELALLQYPGFFVDPFPALAASWRVNLSRGSVSYRTYADSLNPPILHRKELLLPPHDPRREVSAALTAACESIGLFDDPRRIGYRRQWEQLVRERGYRIVGHELLPLGNLEDGDGEDATDWAGAGELGWQAARHRTALSRYGFSAPIQSLARHGFLDGRYRLFDYGCGRSDDVRGLRENGLAATGWDPYFAPDEPIESADLVNLGFVINVIEDFDERLEALTRAWSLADTLLVVSVMLANQNDARGEPFRDGVRTLRGTFQRYYTQAEIKAFLEEVLDEEAIPVAPGVLYVFRDKEAEQRFFVERYRSRRNRLREPSLRERPSTTTPRRDRSAEKYATHASELEGLWTCWLRLGRRPDRSEVEDALALTEGFGSIAKALRFLETHKAKELGEATVSEELAQAEEARIDDLTLYFALDQFERRRPYTQLEPGLRRDIKQFFGDYRSAQSAGWELLLQIADARAIEKACREAAEHGLGWLATDQVADADGVSEADDGEPRQRPVSLQLDARLVEQLPALLRVYVGAAAAAYGDYRNADLIKIHIGSGKLSLMRFDDFDDAPLPRMLERVKIKLRAQDVEYYAYGEDFEPPYLYWKSRYINEEHPRYPDQLAFDEALDVLGLFDLSGYGPSAGEFQKILARHRWEIDDFTLIRPRQIPSLDDPCGRFLRFRDLIECGETRAETAIENLPRSPASWNALYELAEQILDPVIDWFGMIRLTYGFCSPELARTIRTHGGGPIDPSRDQHAAHEPNRRGNPVCPRLGAAVDFAVEDEDMLEVARWVAEHTPFDRLYFYGADQPIHVSYGPQQTRQVVAMRQSGDGRLVPRVVKLENFLRDGASGTD
ncbi:hypothetical protein Thimo_2732 [Thioflavicoccus mobilis 8321]|uniref:DNA phosphorothioation-associated methyltransferase n=1 Tax=Thioflavicoccus mobilis 8321 TaxID=765912 RepID=L0H049_9GAMM|nr:DNA phosphorothioation-associated putative methyltransferase [Thioflavicoccus mobilis]AGA91442.1 hypothetical protein Thimo_2732 [Thioflavicoccus mobilis 8321]